MDGQSPQAPAALFEPISKISQAINEKDQQLIENEALIIYTKLEISKLKTATKHLTEQSHKLEAETELLKKETQELDNSIVINRKSLDVKSDMHINIKQEISRLETEIKEQTNRYEMVYSEYLKKYKEASNVYERYHPLFKQLEQLQNENLKFEVQFKTLRAKVLEKKKQIKDRREYHGKIFNATIVKFAENTLNYWETRALAREIDEATKEESSLIQQLHDVEALAVERNKELRLIKRTPVSSELSKIKDTALMADQNWNELNSSNNNHNFIVPAPISTSTCPRRFNPLDNPQSEEMLLQIRARCEQRQQLWEKQRSFVSPTSNRRQTSLSANRDPKKQMPILCQAPLHGQKRSLQLANLPKQNSKIKNSKTVTTCSVGNENLPFTKQQVIQNMTPIPTGIENPTFAMPNSKVKIISVHNIRSSERSSSMNQHLFSKPSMSQAINKNLNQVMSQQTPHYLTKLPQNYPSENMFSQVQSQDTNMLTPSMNITAATPKRQSQGYQPENLFSEDANKTALVSSGTINKGATHYIAQAPLEYRSENVPSQSQLSFPEKITQEVFQAGSVDQHALIQFETGATQNLTHMRLSGNQPAPTQASDKSGDNTGVTSQSSTFSQKYLELQQFLDSGLQEPVYAPPSAPQIKTNIKPVEPVLTSPFFNKPNPGEATELATQLHENSAAQELLSRNENDSMNPANISQYLDTSETFYNQEIGDNTAFTDDYPQVLSPDYDENNASATEPQPQPTGFSFNFIQPQTQQAGTTRFTFMDNTAAASNPFINMF